MAKLPPKIGASFEVKPPTDTPAVVVDTKPVRTTLDMERPFWMAVQKWLGERQAVTGRKVTLAALNRELLREVTGQADDDATDEQRAALAIIVDRVLSRVTS